MSGLTIADWLTGDSVVLSLEGDLDEAGCLAVKTRLQHLLCRWPGILVTLDLAGVRTLESSAAEDLFLDIVAMRSRTGMLRLSSRGGPCLALLGRLAIPHGETLPNSPPAGRRGGAMSAGWPVAFGVGGVTA